MVAAVSVGAASVALERSAPRVANGDAPWVVFMSAIPWRSNRNRQQELALQLARTRRVLFVEPPRLVRAPRLRVERLSASLWRATPPTVLPLGRFVPPANRLNRRVAAGRLASWLAGHPGDRLVWIDEDLAGPVIGLLGETACVYDAADLDWTFTRRWNRPHLRRALHRAVGLADLVTTSSRALTATLTAAGGNVHELLNGCDARHFRPEGPRSSLVEAISPPRLGYIGALDERAFDAPLVAAVARARPQWSLVLAGRAGAGARLELDGLENVHLLGSVNYGDVPALVRAFDVCLIPYRLDGRAGYVHPKKFYEYLSAGKPVVSTPLPALDGVDAPYRRGRTADEFVAAVEAALAEGGSPERARRRRDIARANSWDARGVTLRVLLDRLEEATA